MTAGTLTVGFDVPAPGFWNGRVTGTTIKNPTGFEAGLAQAIAKQLGLSKVDFVRAPFGGLFSPAPKKYDFALEEVTITPERAKVVGFSTSYFDANQGVLIRKGLPKPTSIAVAEEAAAVRPVEHHRAVVHPAHAPSVEAGARLLGIVDRRVSTRWRRASATR